MVEQGFTSTERAIWLYGVANGAAGAIAGYILSKKLEKAEKVPTGSIILGISLAIATTMFSAMIIQGITTEGQIV